MRWMDFLRRLPLRKLCALTILAMVVVAFLRWLATGEDVPVNLGNLLIAFGTGGFLGYVASSTTEALKGREEK